ncbi:Homocysteine S-methyltransferase domain-containing protein [Strongyloides ratti]|uniref:Homocysteine S-methyltransferase domain-containing protein n=1 Tax=Strongyloides ratti TaxID=34506 RepID=A0A090LUG7_STRRB|nr:Homocysteine S-methyltransferase domain-containing protein [Strongyloides ratti]CEF71254.1 Homocysteine S-methyltransferase domain-containing protein [Strongyloides ratti]
MGYHILDGGLGTSIEFFYNTHDDDQKYIDYGFFSFNLAVNKKWLQLANIHMQFLKNYSSTLYTSHYQASIPRLYKKIKNLNEIWYLLKISYEIPKSIMQLYNKNTKNNLSLPSVIISCGPIATFFQNKSEYLSKNCHPLYKNNIFQKNVVEMYYKIQVQSLLSLSSECIMFETFTLYDEIESLINVLDSLLKNHIANFCLGLSITCKNEKFTYGDCNIIDIFRLVKKSNKFKYFGINCTNPNYISGILNSLKSLNSLDHYLEIIIKSNKGDIIYEDGVPHIINDAKLFYDYADEWEKIMPITGIGGCCGVLPEDINKLYKIKHKYDTVIETQSSIKNDDLKFLIEKVIDDSEAFCTSKHLGIEKKDLEKFFELIKYCNLE